MEGRRRHVGAVGHLFNRHARRDVRLDPLDRLSDAVALRILREGGGKGRPLRTEKRAEVDFAQKHRSHHLDFVRTVKELHKTQEDFEKVRIGALEPDRLQIRAARPQTHAGNQLAKHLFVERNRNRDEGMLLRRPHHLPHRGHVHEGVEHVARTVFINAVPHDGAFAPREHHAERAAVDAALRGVSFVAHRYVQSGNGGRKLTDPSLRNLHHPFDERVVERLHPSGAFGCRFLRQMSHFFSPRIVLSVFRERVAERARSSLPFSPHISLSERQGKPSYPILLF